MYCWKNQEASKSCWPPARWTGWAELRLAGHQIPRHFIFLERFKLVLSFLCSPVHLHTRHVLHLQHIFSRIALPLGCTVRIGDYIIISLNGTRSVFSIITLSFWRVRETRYVEIRSDGKIPKQALFPWYFSFFTRKHLQYLIIVLFGIE